LPVSFKKVLEQIQKKMSNACPCGSKKEYEQCCQIAHNNSKSVISAEALMRSRYSAFVKADIAYLLKSWSIKTRDNSKRFAKELLEWTTSVQWVKLEVSTTTQGQLNDTTGTVAFKAFYLENGVMQCITENSYFEKENGCWVYVKAL